MTTYKVESALTLRRRVTRLERCLAFTRERLVRLEKSPSLKTLLRWHAEYYATSTGKLRERPKEASHRDALRHFANVAAIHGYTADAVAGALGNISPATVRRYLANYSDRCLDSETFHRAAAKTSNYYTRRVLDGSAPS